MTILESVIAKAASRSLRVAIVSHGEAPLPEAAERITALGLGQVIVVGDGGVRPPEDPRLGAVAGVLRERWPERGRDGIHALDLAAHPLLFAAGLIARGEADLCLAGPATTTDAVEEAVRWIMGPERAIQGRGSINYFATVDG